MTIRGEISWPPMGSFSWPPSHDFRGSPLGAAAALAGNTWNGYHWADANGDHADNSISLTPVDHLDNYQDEYTEVLIDWNDSAGPLSLTSKESTLDTPLLACQGDDSEAARIEISKEIHV